MRLLWVGLAVCGAMIASAAAANVTAQAPTAGAATMPSPKAGLWQRASSQDGAPPDTSTKCLDGSPLDPMQGTPVTCASVTVQRTADGGFVFDGDCPNNGVSAKIHMTGVGDFNKAFSTGSTMTMTGGPGGAMTTKNNSTWTYQGACPGK